MTPFIEQSLSSKPSRDIFSHYIFDREDAKAYLHRLRFGFDNDLNVLGKAFPKLKLSLYTHLFPNNPTIYSKNPHFFCEGEYQYSPFTSHVFSWIWNKQRRHSDFYQYRFLSSLNSKIALKAEYSHRGPYYWRKADRSSYILEALHHQSELINSMLSDPRKTLTASLHYKLTPLDTLSYVTRFVMDKKGRQSSIKEYKIEYETSLRCHWSFKIAYERTMIESNRISLSLNLMDSLPKL